MNPTNDRQLAWMRTILTAARQGDEAAILNLRSIMKNASELAPPADLITMVTDFMEIYMRLENTQAKRN